MVTGFTFIAIHWTHSRKPVGVAMHAGHHITDTDTMHRAHGQIFDEKPALNLSCLGRFIGQFLLHHGSQQSAWILPSRPECSPPRFRLSCSPSIHCQVQIICWLGRESCEIGDYALIPILPFISAGLNVQGNPLSRYTPRPGPVRMVPSILW